MKIFLALNSRTCYKLLMLKINNRIIHNATGHSLPQIKRWAVAFLDPDPSSGQHSGRVRTYEFQQAAKVILGGFLVSHLKYNMQDAYQIIKDLDVWLVEMGWPIAQFGIFERINRKLTFHKNASFGWENLEVSVQRWYRGFSYRVKIVFERKQDPNSKRTIEEYEEKLFQNFEGAVASERHHTFNLSGIIENFAAVLCYHLNRDE